MRKTVFTKLLIASFLTLSLAPFSSAGLPQKSINTSALLEEQQVETPNPDFVPNQLLIRTRLDAISFNAPKVYVLKSPSLKILFEKWNVTSAVPISTPVEGIFLLNVDSDTDPAEIALDFAHNSEVLTAEPNYIYSSLPKPKNFDEQSREIAQKSNPNDEITVADLLMAETEQITTAMVLEAIKAATEGKAHAIKMAFGTPHSSKLLEETIAITNHNNVAFIAVSDDKNLYPSHYFHVFPLAEKTEPPILDSNAVEPLEEKGGGGSTGPEMRRPDYLLWTAQTDVVAGGPVDINWSHLPTAAVTSQDWIAMYRVVDGIPEEDNTKFIRWLSHIYQYNSGATRQGSVRFTVPTYGIYPGTYVFKYLKNGNYEHAAVSNPITIRYPGDYNVTVVPTVDIGQNMSFSWNVNSTAPVTPQDWIAIFFEYEANNQQFVVWQPIYHYTGGARSGNAQFTVPSSGVYPGRYVLKYLLNGIYNEAAVSNAVTVKYPGINTLTVTPTFARNSDRVSVSWNINGVTPSSTDWIAMYAKGDRNNTNFLRFLTPIYYYNSNATRTGTGQLDIPFFGAQSGRYVFKYLLNGLYNHVTESNDLVIDVGQPPVITNARVSNITANSAIYQWDTDIPSTSQGDFVPAISLPYWILGTEDPTLVRNHSIAIYGGTGGFLLNTAYLGRVISKAGLQTISPNFQFNTNNVLPDTTPPVITSILASNITRTGATISFTTNELSDTEVKYWITTSTIFTRYNSQCVFLHQMNLPNLTPNTAYIYNVAATDPSRNQRRSPNQPPFQTLP